MSVNNPASAKMTKSGTTHFRSQTCIPVSSTANTASAVSSNDIVVGNSTLFPQASALAAIHDKVKFHKLKLNWVPALPTTCGGTGVMFFDTDRTDVGPTTMQEAMQNKGARAGPLWAKNTYVCDRKMLRSNEMFSTLSGASTSSATNNTFSGPGKVHFFYTSQPGITYTTSTVIGFIIVEYELEFMFPTAKTDTTVPTRRTTERVRDVSSVTYDRDTVMTYQNFQAGCLRDIDFYTFLTLFDKEGRLDVRRAIEYDPDATALSLAPHTSYPSSNEPFMIRRDNVGDLNSVTITGFSRCPSFSPDWNSETGSIHYD